MKILLAFDYIEILLFWSKINILIYEIIILFC